MEESRCSSILQRAGILKLLPSPHQDSEMNWYVKIKNYLHKWHLNTEI